MTDYAKYKGRYKHINEICREDKAIRDGKNLPKVLRRCCQCDEPFISTIYRKCKKCKEKERESGAYDGMGFDYV